MLSLLQMSSKNGRETFARIQANIKGQYQRSEESVALSRNLSIPHITTEPGQATRHIWREQSYEKFFQRLERQNPDAALTKDMVDAAFRVATSRVSRALAPHDRGKAIARVSTYAGTWWQHQC